VESAGDFEWWGEFKVPRGYSRRWKIGPLLLRVRRLHHEWQVSRGASGPASDHGLEVGILEEGEEDGGGALISRYATSGTADTLVVTPVLPDQSVISRPERPISVLPKQSVDVYVGAPVWIRLEEAPNTLLGDLPAATPIRTWWGPNTREGELCYATRTHGRLELGDAVQYPHRVLTAIEVTNATDEPLLIERISLPARRLSLYAAEDGRLWTESIRLERTSHADFAELSINPGPPAPAPEATKLSEPREADSEHALFRAFGSLFK
jgi:hypothetical protein